MELSEKIKALPRSSGVYIMRDESGNIIYIGKAVNLANRVRQYFSNSVKLPKVQAMVDNIKDFDYIITLTEKDAFSLESNLIKKYKPKYNILLKDDKASPYIRIDLTQEFPTIETTRKVKKDRARYFGPYFNGIRVNEIIDIIKTCYCMRTCPKNYKKQRRECLNYHINLCLAPCCGHVNKDEYMAVVRNVIAFLSGREDTAERLITQKMEAAVETEEFERAINYRNQLMMLKKLKERTLSELGAETNVDSFAYVTDSRLSVVSVSIVRDGKMMGVKNFSFVDASFTEAEAISSFLIQYYSQGGSAPDLICLENEFNTLEVLRQINHLLNDNIEISFPKIGTKKKLVTMAKTNAQDYLNNNAEKIEHEKDMTERAAEELGSILGLPYLRRIECYDISNISGVDKVASGVVFIDGKASRSDYRRYKIRTVEGADDFACMGEVIKRRLARYNISDEKFNQIPDLIVIDGGKGQLSYAYESMKSEGLDIPMIGLAEKNEEIFTLESSLPIILSKESYPLKLLIRIRDEAHRFAITYHRNLRNKRYNSSLDNINGVGAVKRKILLAHFENFDDIKTADIETLSSIKGIDRRTAGKIAEYFENQRKGRIQNEHNGDGK